MQKDIEQTEDWQGIWARRNALDTFIDMGRSTYNYFFRRVHRRYLTLQTDMLELGCGRASLSLSLAPEMKRLSGIDISQVAVAQAAQYAAQHGINNARFAVGDVTKMTHDELYNFVWSQGLIEHFEDPTMVARAHYDALIPGGTVLLSVPYTYSYHALWYYGTRPKLTRRFWPWVGVEQRFFTKKQLLEVGKAITPNAKVFLLQPFPLGLVFLEMKKPA